MMPSGTVLLVAALLTSPALWSGVVVGAMPLDVALTRYLIATVVCSVVLSMVADLIWPKTVAPVAPEEPTPEA